MKFLVYAFSNPIKDVHTNEGSQGRVEFFDKPSLIVDGADSYYNGTSVRSQDPVGALAEAGILREYRKRLNRLPDKWWFSRHYDAERIEDAQTIKTIIDCVEIPDGSERFFTLSYKKGKKLDKYTSKNGDFVDENFVGDLSRTQIEVVARDLSKEIGKPCSALTSQGFYDMTIKGNPLLKYGSFFLREGFVRPDGHKSSGFGSSIEIDRPAIIGSGPESRIASKPAVVFENLSLAPKREIKLTLKEKIEKHDLNSMEEVENILSSVQNLATEASKLGIREE
jgi:hypothetical protein